MATEQRVLSGFVANDAEFRAWCQSVHAMLTGAGCLVQTPDTGQIDLAAVLRPASANLSAGYRIYRFQDPLQATMPVFLKVEFGTGSIVTMPSLWLTVGTGTDGAGALVGQVGSRVQANLSGGATVAGNAYTAFCSGSVASGRVMLLSGYDPASSSRAHGFSVERPKNSAGVDQPDFIAVFNLGPAYGQQMIPAGGVIPARGTSAPVLPNANGQQSTFGTGVALLPQFAVVGKTFLAWHLAFTQVDIAAQVPIQVSHLGAAHTFLPLYFGSQIGLALLWE